MRACFRNIFLLGGFGVFGAISLGLWLYWNLEEGMVPALQSAGEKLPEVAELRRLYPGSEEFIQHYLGSGKSTHWVGIACIDGRFELSLHVPVSLGFNKRSVDSWGQSSGWVGEAVSVDDRSIQYGDNQRQFGPKEWGALVLAGGDLRAIGLDTEGRTPLPGFRRLKGLPE